MEPNGIAKDIALLVVGVAAGFLPWLLDKAGIEMPKYGVVTAGVFTIIALAWGLNNLVLLTVPQTLRSPVMSVTTALFVSLAVAALSWWTIRAVGVREKAEKVKTELRLRFSGKPEKPFQIHADNIANWYTVWTPSAAISFAENQKIRVPENWVIFVLFKKLTTYQEVDVSFSHPGFPQWETKERTTRFAIINVSGSIPAGNLEIYAK